MSPEREAGWAACLNLLIPGVGIILLGRVAIGLLVGLIFVLCVNYALWATLLIPDEFPSWARGLGIGLAGGTYVGAQLRLAQTVRSRDRQRRAALRRQALNAAREALRLGDSAAALEALGPVRAHAEHDLLIAYRLAQLYTGAGDVAQALAAWQRVRALDRHRIYRDEIRANEEVLARLRVAGTPPPPAESGRS